MDPILLLLLGMALVAAIFIAVKPLIFMAFMIHEAGHWLAARTFRLPAPVFSLSPKRAPYRVVGRALGTEFRWSRRWMKGCYVSVIFDPSDTARIAAVETETGIKVPESRPALWWQSAIVFAAGPLANFIWTIACVLLAYWLMPSLSELSWTLAMLLLILGVTAFINAVEALVNLVPRRGRDGWYIREEIRKRNSEAATAA